MTRREALALLGSFAVAPLASPKPHVGFDKASGNDRTAYYTAAFNDGFMSCNEVRLLETRQLSLRAVSKSYNIPIRYLEKLNANRT